MRGWRDRFRLVRSISELAPAHFIIETVKEDLELKRQIYDQLESAVRDEAVIASNTSSLPISVLQSGPKTSPSDSSECTGASRRRSCDTSK